MWRSAAWLCWVQAVFQLYPLPKTMGRQIFGSLASICARRLDFAVQVSIFRRCLTAVALLTLALAMLVMSWDGEFALARQWPLLLLLGLLLWASSHSADVSDMLLADQESRESVADEDRLGESGMEDDAGNVPRGGILRRIFGSIQNRKDRKRLQRTLAQERREAVDAQRLDDILTQLHRDGVDSLSDEDRKILDRVSENLRKERQSDSDA